MSEVEEEAELAREAMSDFEHMQEISLRRRYTTLYFAVYHAARSALIEYGYAPKTHSGTDSLVHNILLKDKELVDQDQASLFSRLKTRREQADYETKFLGDEEELEELHQAARNLSETLLDQKGVE